LGIGPDAQNVWRSIKTATATTSGGAGVAFDSEFNSFAFEATQLEEQKRVAVEGFREQIIHGRDVLARVRIIGATAIDHEVAGLRREERNACIISDLLDLAGHCPRQQLRGEQRFVGHRLGEFRPLVQCECLHGNRDFVRRRLRTLHLGFDHSRLHVDQKNLPSARVAAAATEPFADVETLDDGDPAFGPPAFAKAS